MADNSDNSFLSINYSLRPNKVIGRKIIFNTLGLLTDRLKLRDARYIGMGSIWFVDFIMAHRMLGIAKMISIEASEEGHARASFNAPFGCITVKHGYTEHVLPTLGLDNHSNVVWLDYDTPIDGSAKADIETLVETCKEGSVLLVTINASAKDLAKRIKPNEPLGVDLGEFQGYLDEKLGDDGPRGLAKDDVTEAHFPNVARSTLANMIDGALRRSGRPLRFVKVLDFAYRDSTTMVTVGGVLVSEKAANAVTRLMDVAKWPGIIKNTIRVPHLTLREKLSLDRLLPSPRPPTVGNVRRKAGFPLSAADIKAYHEYYSYYPTFAELQI